MTVVEQLSDKIMINHQKGEGDRFAYMPESIAFMRMEVGGIHRFWTIMDVTAEQVEAFFRALLETDYAKKHGLTREKLDFGTWE
ncbi:hypothetical protein [Aneurinibacillus tyrosinisolvens]|uniref:hypothetical protein n=1 Tax=Aneurinibacillus tyrosinisolvens TaxID=1443435 RepID=UPI00063F4CB5|nr:hypothetical protein [Aneurinibacillus tyrosinisolvens]